MTIERFIELVEQFENNHHNSSQRRNTSYMMTRLRKIFYGKDGWDNYLITGASSVPRSFRPREVETSRFTLSIPWSPDFIDVVRKRYELQDAGGHQIHGGQELRLQNGDYCDIGHVFAGLDAFNHPNMVDGPGTINITRNHDAVTWVGDLGSVLAEAKFAQLHPSRGRTSPLVVSEYQPVIDEFASPQDMLGNIDAYVIGNFYNISGRRPPTMAPATWQAPKVSEILRAYYLQDQTTRLRRFSHFARRVGLNDWNGTQFANETGWTGNYIDEVNDAAALYVGASTASAWYGFPSRAGFTLGMSGNQGSEVLLRSFLHAIKNEIHREP